MIKVVGPFRIMGINNSATQHENPKDPILSITAIETSNYAYGALGKLLVISNLSGHLMFTSLCLGSTLSRIQPGVTLVHFYN
jgi:hypothetical protein